MQLLLNDLSLDGQFPSVPDFQNAMRSIMLMRTKIQQFGRELFCHRNLVQAQVTHKLNMQQAIQQFNKDERLALMGWLTQHGPFWDYERKHDPDDYLECLGSIVVTDTALGEAAFHCFYDRECHTISLSPSSWLFTPISVVWHSENIANIDVINHWEINTLEPILKKSSPPIKSWEQLASVIKARCPNLIFSDDSFQSLEGHPFVNSASQRIVKLLETLNKYKICFDENGQRAEEGQRIYQDHFTGQKAWFTDSSDGEKNEFKNELTFKHPNNDTETLFCTWHGKIKTPQFRIHFSWPIIAKAQ